MSEVQQAEAGKTWLAKLSPVSRRSLLEQIDILVVTPDGHMKVRRENGVEAWCQVDAWVCVEDITESGAMAGGRRTPNEAERVYWKIRPAGQGGQWLVDTPENITELMSGGDEGDQFEIRVTRMSPVDFSLLKEWQGW